MNKINFALVLVIIIINNYYAQQNDNRKYFPHADGDMWEFFYSDGPMYVDTAQVFNRYDSTDANRNIYVTQTSRYINPIQIPAIPFSDTMSFKIDTLNQVWGRVHELENVIAFKLDAEQGEQWILKTYYDNGEVMGYEMARVGLIYEQNLWGVNYSIMNTFYYFASDSTDTTGLSRYGVDLAKGIGIIWHGGGESPGIMEIKGAVINGILYGDTTNVITAVENNKDNILPSILELKQNYPNPFNAGTNIGFFLFQNTNVSIIIYNSNGEEVNKIIDDKYYSKGEYSVYWNGKNMQGQDVSSGIYFYSFFQNSKPIKTKSMLLLK